LLDLCGHDRDECAAFLLVMPKTGAPPNPATRGFKVIWHRVSMEEEARRILREALVRVAQTQPLGQRLKQRFAEVADADFALPSRQIARRSPNWDETP
jgi:antitoxin FitA